MKRRSHWLHALAISLWSLCGCVPLAPSEHVSADEGFWPDEEAEELPDGVGGGGAWVPAARRAGTAGAGPSTSA